MEIRIVSGLGLSISPFPLKIPLSLTSPQILGANRQNFPRLSKCLDCDSESLLPEGKLLFEMEKLIRPRLVPI